MENQFPRGIRWSFLVFSALVILMLGYITSGFVTSYRDQVRAWQTFQPVPAVVLDSRVRRISSDEGGDSFFPYVRYTYRVAGKRYESDRFFFTGWGFNDYSEAQARLEQYPVGATVTAYYDPSAPDVAVLDNSLPVNTRFVVAGLALFWGIAGAILLYAIWPALRGLLAG